MLDNIQFFSDVDVNHTFIQSLHYGLNSRVKIIQHDNGLIFKDENHKYCYLEPRGDGMLYIKYYDLEAYATAEQHNKRVFKLTDRYGINPDYKTRIITELGKNYRDAIRSISCCNFFTKRVNSNQEGGCFAELTLNTRIHTEINKTVCYDVYPYDAAVVKINVEESKLDNEYLYKTNRYTLGMVNQNEVPTGSFEAYIRHYLTKLVKKPTETLTLFKKYSSVQRILKRDYPEMSAVELYANIYLMTSKNNAPEFKFVRYIFTSQFESDYVITGYSDLYRPRNFTTATNNFPVNYSVYTQDSYMIVANVKLPRTVSELINFREALM
jgi:hypothetical protein